MGMRYSSFLHELFDADIGLIGPIMEGFYSIFEAELTPEDQVFIEADPTPNKKYKVWILRMKKAGLKQEDLYKITEYLTIFDKYKQKLEIKDINQYKTVGDLFTAIKPIRDAIESGVDIRSDNQKRKAAARATGDIDVVFESNGWKILHPKTKDAACQLGTGTEWCTATRSNDNMFDHYNAKGPIYIIASPDNKKWQFHKDSEQFMDSTDTEVSNIKFLPVDVTVQVAKLFNIVALLSKQLTKEQSDALVDLLIESTTDENIVSTLKIIMAETSNPAAQEFVMTNIRKLDDEDLSSFLYSAGTFENVLVNGSLELLIYLYDNHQSPTHALFARGRYLRDAINTIMIRDQFDKFRFILRAGAGENSDVNNDCLDKAATMLSFNEPGYEYYRRYAMYILSNEFPIEDDVIVQSLSLLFKGVDANVKLSNEAADAFESRFPSLLKDAMSYDTTAKRCLINLGEFIKRTPRNIDAFVAKVEKYMSPEMASA